MKECIRGVLQKARECIVVAKEGSYKRRVYWGIWPAQGDPQHIYCTRTQV